MNWYKIFYLVTVADKLHDAFLALTIIFGILLCVLFFIWLSRKYKDVGISDIQLKEVPEQKVVEKYGEKGWHRFMRWFWTFTILTPAFLILTCGIPRKKDMILIIAGGAATEFVTTDSSAKALPAELTNYLRVEIQKMTTEAGVEMRKALNTPTVRDTLLDKSKEELIELLEKQIK